MMNKCSFARLLCVLPAALISFSCSFGLNPAPHSETSVVLTVSLPENAVAEASRTAQSARNASGSRFMHPDTSSVSVTVSAPDMTPQTVSASIGDGKNSVSIEFPDIVPGVGRVFEVTLYDAVGTKLAAGSASADVVKYKTNPVAVTPIPENAANLYPGPGSFFNIPSTSAGKTFVFVMSDFAPGKFDAIDPTCPNANISIYDQNGKRVSSGNGICSFAAPQPCYLVISIPQNATTASSFGYVPGFSVGDAGPGGGYIFYVADNAAALSQGWKYLEVSPYSTQFDTNAAWVQPSDQSTEVLINKTGLGGGRENTDAFIAKYTSSGIYPAQLCYTLSYNTKSDWYCPSRDELELIRTTFYNNSLSSSDPRYFDGDSYWTSTEYSATEAYTLSFGSGFFPSLKSYGRRTRAIRQFLY